MKLVKEFLHLPSILILISCGTVCATITVLNERENTPGINQIRTNFINALQIKKLNANSEEDSMDHKLKFSVADSAKMDSKTYNVVYLLKDKELKGFLRTLPIEMLRKLRRLASSDIESAQNFVIKLFKERRRNGSFEFSKRISSEARPLVSSNNISSSFILNTGNGSSLNPEETRTRFLEKYKFRANITQTGKIPYTSTSSGTEAQNGQSQWTPIFATPSPEQENSTTADTVTYIVHEVVYPKHPDENSFGTSKGTTEKYPSLQTPMKYPLPTPPMYIQNSPFNDNYSTLYKLHPTPPAYINTPSYNYRPTVLSHPSPYSSSRQKSPHNILDNYYSASRHYQDLNYQNAGGQGSFSYNHNQNPTVYNHHQSSISPEYAWTIGQVHFPSANSFDTTDINTNANVNPIQKENERQPIDNIEYFSGSVNNPGNGNNHETQLIYNTNAIPQQTSNNFNGQQLSIINANRPGLYPHLYPSPSNYYSTKPLISFQNSLQNPGFSTTTNNNVYHQPDNGLSSSHYNQLYGNGWTAGIYPNAHLHNLHSLGGDTHKGLFHRFKSYFTNGNRTVAEKVFEISLGILAFLAFGGYVVMLIYQVFAVNATVPLFPLVTQTIPRNPSLLGVLFGRSLRSRPKESYIVDLYLDKIEEQVRFAIKNFIAKLGNHEVYSAMY